MILPTSWSLLRVLGESRLDFIHYSKLARFGKESVFTVRQYIVSSDCFPVDSRYRQKWSIFNRNPDEIYVLIGVPNYTVEDAIAWPTALPTSEARPVIEDGNVGI